MTVILEYFAMTALLEYLGKIQVEFLFFSSQIIIY